MTTKKDKLAKAFAAPVAKPTHSARRPAAASTTAAAPTVPSAPSLRRKKEAGEETERINAYVPVALATDFRMRCARDRRSASDAVTEAIEQWLARGA